MIPDNQIWYTSSDGNVVTPKKTDVFGANIISNTYENGKGVIKFDSSVTTIGDYAFQECTSLTSVAIGNSVIDIGYNVFTGCSGLTSITWNAESCADFPFVSGYGFTDIRSQITSFIFGDSVEHIPACLCYGMSKLTSITIPNSVTSIGEHAFYMCSGLASITCKATTPPTLGLGNLSNFTVVYVPVESVEAYKSATSWSDYVDKIQPIP